MLSINEFQGLPILIFVNKLDLRNAVTVKYVKNQLELNKRDLNLCYTQGCCATTGDGLLDGLDWICSKLKLRF